MSGYGERELRALFELLTQPWVERFVSWAVTAEDDLDFEGVEVPGRVQAMVRAMWPDVAAHQDAINSDEELLARLRKAIRTRGGNVQAALGSDPRTSL